MLLLVNFYLELIIIFNGLFIMNSFENSFTNFTSYDFHVWYLFMLFDHHLIRFFWQWFYLKSSSVINVIVYKLSTYENVAKIFATELYLLLLDKFCPPLVFISFKSLINCHKHI